jgi:hypothetical protein
MAAAGRWGDVVQALVQWRHPVNSSEAWDVIHRAVPPASHRRIRMVMVFQIISV